MEKEENILNQRSKILMFNWIKKFIKEEKKNKKDEEVDLKINLNGEELNFKMTREEMLCLTHEAANYGRKPEEHLKKLLWDEYEKEKE
jgi:hypothetical protein